MPTSIKIGSRASALALTQTDLVINLIADQRPDWRLERVSFSTTGDRITNKPLADIGGKALFVKELELGLLQGSIDAAVHSLKDVPGDMDESLFCLLPVGARADARDALVLAEGLDKLDPESSARIGTVSARRSAQLQRIYPRCQVGAIRGNVQTRIARLDSGEFDAIVLARAGLQRLQLESRINALFAVEQMVPAIGQGVIALQVLRADKRWDWLTDSLDSELALCVDYERALARALGADCFSTLGAHARCQADKLHFDLFYVDPKDQQQQQKHYRFDREHSSSAATLEARMRALVASLQSETQAQQPSETKHGSR